MGRSGGADGGRKAKGAESGLWAHSESPPKRPPPAFASPPALLIGENKRNGRRDDGTPQGKRASFWGVEGGGGGGRGRSGGDAFVGGNEAGHRGEPFSIRLNRRGGRASLPTISPRPSPLGPSRHPPIPPFLFPTRQPPLNPAASFQ